MPSTKYFLVTVLLGGLLIIGLWFITREDSDPVASQDRATLESSRGPDIDPADASGLDELPAEPEFASPAARGPAVPSQSDGSDPYIFSDATPGQDGAEPVIPEYREQVANSIVNSLAGEVDQSIDVGLVIHRCSRNYFSENRVKRDSV